MAHLKPNSSATLSAPSPTPSNSSSSGAKRKREEMAQGIVYSQPQDTGKGHHIYTQVTYAIDHLKEKQTWRTFKQILDFLNLQIADSAEYEQTIQSLKHVFQKKDPNSRIEYSAKTDMYRYKPKYDIRNGAELKGWLQNQKSAQGLSVKELKDGWPNPQDEITVMEKKHELLVNRNKKDGQAKTVWINDPSLMHKMDPDFLHDWHTIQLPANPDDLRNKLLAADLKPASAPREIKAAKPMEKKRKAARRGGKQTNTHMANILKDFSHLRK